MKLFDWIRGMKEMPRGARHSRGDLNAGEYRFDFRKVEDVDDATVAAFFASTHEKSRRMPLLVAGWVAAQLEDRLTQAAALDALGMAEIRGGLRALRQFAAYYQSGIAEWNDRAGRGKSRDAEEA